MASQRIISETWEHDVGGPRNTITYLATNEASGNPDDITGIPAWGAQHPTVSTMYVVNRSSSVEAGQPATWRVTVTYAVPTPGELPGVSGVPAQRIQVESTTYEQDTVFDIHGDRIKATWFNGFAFITQYPTAKQSLSAATVEITTYEAITAAAAALRAIDYVDTVNNAIWYGWSPETWRFEDIQAEPWGEFGQFMEVRHVLTYRADTWRFLSYHVNAGRVPPDATDGNGFARFEVKFGADFSAVPIVMVTKP